MEVSDGLTLTLGGTTIGLIVKEFLAWHRSRNQKTKLENDPVNVNKLDKYVTRGEFNKHVELNEAAHKAIVEDNSRDHESLFGRMNRNDRETSELKGLLTVIRDDLSAIKAKMFKRS